jgi:hypothetical protein
MTEIRNTLKKVSNFFSIDKKQFQGTWNKNGEKKLKNTIYDSIIKNFGEMFSAKVFAHHLLAKLKQIIIFIVDPKF